MERWTTPTRQGGVATNDESSLFFSVYTVFSCVDSQRVTKDPLTM